jgi:hypothetical protein
MHLSSNLGFTETANFCLDAVEVVEATKDHGLDATEASEGDGLIKGLG